MKRKFLLCFILLAGFLTVLVARNVPSVHASTTVTFSTSTGANDGMVIGNSSSYSTAHGTGSQYDNSGDYVEFGQWWSGSTYEVLRGFLKFDTSSIPAGATISSARLCLRGGGTDESGTDFTINLQKWTGDTPIDAGDFNSFDATNYDDGLFSTSSWSTSAYNNVTISNFGLITKAGNTLVCVRSSRDVSSTQPTGAEYVYVWSYDGVSSRAPLLVVTYTDATPPTYSNVASNSTIAGSSCLFSCKWTDETGLSGFILATNNTGPWANQTWTALGSNPGWGNLTLTLNSTVGTVVGWKEYGNDTSNNWNVTSILTLTITPSTVSITVTSSPTGSGYVTVDSGAVTTPHTYTWNVGDSHTLAANSPANLVAGQSRYVWQSWNDSGTQSHSITVPSSDTAYNATFQLQYYLTVTGGNNIGYGTPSPGGDNWYNSGTSTTVSSDWIWGIITGQSRTAVTNYAIDGASQSPARQGTGTLTTSSVTFSTYHTIVFASSIQYYVTLGTGTVGTTVGQTGSQTADNWYDSASSASISATTPFNNGTMNRFVFLNWTWTRGGVSQTNSSNNPFSITMTNYASATAYWTEDLIDLYSYSIASSRVNVSDTAYINLTYRWVSDHIPVGSSFTVKVNGASKTITSGWTNYTDTSATVQTKTYQLTEAEGGAYYVNSVSPSETWERVKITTGGSVGDAYVHAGSNVLVYYELHYESDNALVTDGTVLLNGSAMLYDGSLLVWEINVTSPTMTTNHYRISAVSGNLYGITALNDVAGLVGPFEWYANLNLHAVDVNFNPLTQAIIFMSNGTVAPPGGVGSIIIGGISGYHNQMVSAEGWANWTGLTNSSISIFVTWYGLTVNQTFTLNFNTDTTLDLACLAYPFTVSSVRFWAASNATVTASSYTSNVLTLGFNSTVNNYMLIASCPIIPRYILNATYDIATCFTSGYLSLTHYGNATLTLSYESWGDLYVQSTDQTLTSASIASGMLQILPAGTNGTIGTLQVYCGALGNPTSTNGFTTGSYGSKIYTGTYVLTGYTLTLGWAVSPFTGGGTTGTTGPSLSVYFVLTFPSTATKGQIVNGTLTVTWQTYAMIYIWQVACNQPYTTWAVNIGALPLGLQSAQAIGNASLPVTLTIPTDIADGSYLVPCSITFQTPTGIAKTVGSTVSLTIGAQAPTSNISMPYIVMAGFLGLFGLFLSTLFVRRSRSRKQQF